MTPANKLIITRRWPAAEARILLRTEQQSVERRKSMFPIIVTMVTSQISNHLTEAYEYSQVAIPWIADCPDDR